MDDYQDEEDDERKPLPEDITELIPHLLKRLEDAQARIAEQNEEMKQTFEVVVF